MSLAGVLVRGWQSVSPFSLVLKALFPIPGLVCQDKSASDCVMGQHAVCELNSSRCRPRVISALLRVSVSPSSSLKLTYVLRTLSGQLSYVVLGQEVFKLHE